jgi:hypothetical protein
LPKKLANWILITYAARAMGRLWSSIFAVSHAALRACAEPMLICVHTTPPSGCQLGWCRLEEWMSLPYKVHFPTLEGARASHSRPAAANKYPIAMWKPLSAHRSLLYASEMDQIKAHTLPTAFRPLACSEVNPRLFMIDGA